jgi:hypothetical protein
MMHADEVRAGDYIEVPGQAQMRVTAVEMPDPWGDHPEEQEGTLTGTDEEGEEVVVEVLPSAPVFFILSRSLLEQNDEEES